MQLVIPLLGLKAYRCGGNPDRETRRSMQLVIPLRGLKAYRCGGEPGVHAYRLAVDRPLLSSGVVSRPIIWTGTVRSSRTVSLIEHNGVTGNYSPLSPLRSPVS